VKKKDALCSPDIVGSLPTGYRNVLHSPSSAWTLCTMISNFVWITEEALQRNTHLIYLDRGWCELLDHVWKLCEVM
jgi:hypothetical protein